MIDSATVAKALREIAENLERETARLEMLIRDIEQLTRMIRGNKPKEENPDG